IIPHADEAWEVKSALENGYRRMRVRLPAVFTVTRDLNSPRTLSFSGIIKARKKTITEWGLDDLGVSAERVGLKGSPTIVTEMRTVENTRKVEFIEGTREEKAEQLVQKLVEVGVL
ncbi:MAG: electron transfer flavoprotein subunit beta, partial [Deltaproteobacteria bacterium]|nr:electron transfer flavoprotein subunit beta [Deltaproteobacteria bacterium]